MPFWVVTFTETGRHFIYERPFTSEDRADSHLEDKYRGKGRVFRTRSRNKVEAAQEIREQLAESGSTSWGKNFKHK